MNTVRHVTHRRLERYVSAWIYLIAFLSGRVAGQGQELAGEVAAKPPVAAVRPTELREHGVVRVDPYYWMRERDDPAVLAYLQAENQYVDQVLAPTRALQEELFQELKAREPRTEVSAPYPEGTWWYYSRLEDGQQYRVHCRRPGPAGPFTPPEPAAVKQLAHPSEDEQILVDVNLLAEGHDFCSMPGVEVTTDGRTMAYAVDFVGRRKYAVRFRDLDSGKYLTETLHDVTPDIVWAEDHKTLFYVRQDPETLRAYQVFRHRLGTDPASDVLVYQEDDPEFSVGLGKTRSRDYVIIASHQTLSSEYRLVDARHPDQAPVVFSPRRADHDYSVDHLGDRFYIVTNDHAPNFRCAATEKPGTPVSEWQEIVPHRADVLLNGVVLLNDWLVAVEEHRAATQLRVLDRNGKALYPLEFDESAYAVFPSPIAEPDTPWLRVVYMSMSTPSRTYDCNLATRERVLVKEQEVRGGFDRENYRCERLWAKAGDGTEVPISLVRRRDTPIDGTAPLLLYGYGSYGSSMSPYFSASTVSLLDRGWVYAIAHVRGGQEMGRAWYEDGKLLRKKNTFTDFIDVAEFLVRERFADPKKVFAMGGSAGGLLMGAVVNMRPDLFRGVIAEVPFVDVVTTMLDDSIPLTTGEYDEWGDPHEKQYFDYMLSYSPYDQVQTADYPHLLVTTGLHDSQVQYWEPAKWVAKLRARKTDDHVLLLKTNMDAGHGGASGRFDRHRETALRYAFLLHLATQEP